MFQRYFDSNLISWYILLHWQQQKCKQIHAWALEISIMSLHLIFKEKEEVSAQKTSTHVAPRSRWVSLWSASASAPESAGKASSLWKIRAQSFETGTFHPSPHPHEQIWWEDFVIWSGSVLSEGCYHGAGLGARADHRHHSTEELTWCICPWKYPLNK